MGVIKDLVLLSCVGVRPVLVHGGGPEINAWLSKLGIKPVFQNGVRVTDSKRSSASPSHRLAPGETMEVVEMVLGGRVNKSLVSLIQQYGGKAVGLCGKDGNLILARPMLDGKLGFTGEVIGIQTELLNNVVSGSYIPVVATVATSRNGDALNVNADTAAGEVRVLNRALPGDLFAQIAAALQAEKLVLMTDVPGVLQDKDDEASILRALDIQSTRAQIQSGVIAGGMIPKVECCIRCLAQGVRAAHIVDGRQPHSLLMELLTDQGVGTMITG